MQSAFSLEAHSLSGDRTGFFKSLALLSDSISYVASSLSLPCSSIIGEFINTADYTPTSHRIPHFYDRWLRYAFVTTLSGSDLGSFKIECYNLYQQSQDDSAVADPNSRVSITYVFKETHFEITNVETAQATDDTMTS